MHFYSPLVMVLLAPFSGIFNLFKDMLGHHEVRHSHIFKIYWTAVVEILKPFFYLEQTRTELRCGKAIEKVCLIFDQTLCEDPAHFV